MQNKLYIACFRCLFAVLRRDKNSMSYGLREDNIESLRSFFDSNNVPYRTELIAWDSIDGVEIEDDSPCNSKVTFSLDGQEYNVLNFNSYLIKNYYAEKICKSLNNKSVDSRVELIGTYAGTRKLDIHQKKAEPKYDSVKDVDIQRPVTIDCKTKNEYVQASLFDLFSKAI